MSKFTVRAIANTPESSAEWSVDLGEDLKNSMIYTNLAYDLLAAAMAKLGVEMSKYVLGVTTPEELTANMACVMDALRAGTVAGK